MNESDDMKNVKRSTGSITRSERARVCLPVSKLTASLLCVCFFGALRAPAAWQPAAGPLKTRWAKDVSPQNALPEYPRPQMVRKEWLNLNGLWDFHITPRDAPKPETFQTQILVPFPVESALSGVMKRVSEDDRLWYRRRFELPRHWFGRRVLLHFGAVDFQTTVCVNGKEVGQHRGGYDGFRLDITEALKPTGINELVVSVWDPTDAGTQPRGKQNRKPNGIWYTSTSGIWQTVWLEPVNAAYITELQITPDVDHNSVTVWPRTPAILGDCLMQVTIRDGGREIYTASVTAGGKLTLPVKNAKLWSPENPHLYTLTAALKLGSRTLDTVESYFGMRKISLGKDSKSFTRLMLNNQPYFQFGPLDQGFWPDGTYTAPTDEALRYDIEMTKKLGFNMARKHVKIEPDRWYYWCDKLGLLVWQDMPSGEKYIRPDEPDIKRSPESAKEFETELQALIEGRGNHHCIVLWVPYNEGWGQWETAHVVDLIKKLDPTRLVDDASGWTDRGVGDVNDLHKYPGPGSPEPETRRAIVLGEFGGLGLPIPGHTWQSEKNWGYRSFTNSAALTDAYLDLIAKLFPLAEEKGLSAAVYTQTTDVEVEVNGLMTYDRELVKMDLKKVAAANRKTTKAPHEDAVLLTPKPAPAPRINGAFQYGCRPGRPFLYRIPCQGDRPMKFTATGLPAGLELDAASGIIQGTAPQRGEFQVMLQAANRRGKATRPFKIVSGDTLSLTPSMGWNHWYAHYDRVTDKMMREAADVMVRSGMADVGYQYVNIDDCWMNAEKQRDPLRVGPARDERGNILPNKHFQDMKALTDYIHAQGLKAGLYTSPGPKTCGGFTGSYQHEAQDAKQFSDWGFDFLKYDWCSYGQIAQGGSKTAPSLEAMQAPYRLMGELLKQQPRDILFNLCQYGMGNVWKWGAEVGGQSWRTAGDLGFELDHIFEVALKNAEHRAWSKPGGWNDPDYIQIGYIGSAKSNGLPEPCRLTPNEQYAFMSLWCLMAAPLFYSGDMSRLDELTLNVLCNPEVIEVDQDALGKCATVSRLSAQTFLMVKDLEDGSKAVGLFNQGNAAAEIAAPWSILGVVGRQPVRDLWRQKELGRFDGVFKSKVLRHGVVLVRVGTRG